MRLVEIGCCHVQALPRPGLRVIARFEDEAHILSARHESFARPGRLARDEAGAIGKLLIGRRRCALAQRITEAFSDVLCHLSSRVLEREAHDTCASMKLTK